MDWHVVQFVDDGIWHVCSTSRIKTLLNGEITAAWPSNGKFYKVKVYATGDKVAMIAAKAKYENSRAGGLTQPRSSSVIKIIKPSKRTRRSMCDVRTTPKNKKELVVVLPKLLVPTITTAATENLEMCPTDNNTAFNPILHEQCTQDNSFIDYVSEDCDNSNKKLEMSSIDNSTAFSTILIEQCTQDNNLLDTISEDCDDNTTAFRPVLNEQLAHVNHLIDDISEDCDSSDEYQPEFSESSESSDASCKSLPKVPEVSDDKEELNYVTEVIANTQKLDSIFLESNSQNNFLEIPPVEMASITVSKGSKRKWDKKFYCTFCKKCFSKLPRHWYRKHNNELEIAKILSLKPNSSERKELIAVLQNRGTFIHNTNIMKTGEGVIIPKRRNRSDIKADVRNYIPCQYCYQLFIKTYLAKHQHNCIFNKEQTEGKKRNRSLRSQNLLMLPLGPQTSTRFRTSILSKMSGDEVFRAIRSDSLIIKYGEAEFNRMGYETRYHRTITDRCRELGRLLLTAKELSPNINKLEQLLNASQYQLLKQSIYTVSGFNEVTNLFETPSLALKLGFTIKKCVSILKGDFLEDEILREKVPALDNFLAVMNAKWHREVTAHAYRTLTERKWNATKRLPLAKDIQKLCKYLSLESDMLRDKMEISADSHTFSKLTEVSLVLTIVLNRRRVGEVQYMLLNEYEKAKNCDRDSDVYNTLSETEKKLSESLILLVIKGKRGRGVPVLLSENLQSNLSILIRFRNDCGVSLENKYLFPSIKHASGFYHAHKVLTKCAKEAGCQHPETITSTRLRKHVAVMAQLLNLREHELDSLAKFMGHDIRVHRQYYRLADETVQLAKISKLLINMEKGKINEMKGKNLDEIEVNDVIDEDDQDGDYQVDDDADDGPVEDNHIEHHELINTNIDPVRNSKKIIQTYKNKTSKKKSKRKSDMKSKVIGTKVPWSEKEISITLTYFKNFINMKMLPGKREIEKFLQENGNHLSSSRRWSTIKDRLNCEIKKLKRACNSTT